MHIRCLLFALFLCLFGYSYAETQGEDQPAIFKWTDENGKVHYGASVPPEYKEVAEQINVKPLNSIAPEPEVKRQNARAVKKMKIEDAIKREAAQNQHTQSTEAPPNPQLSKEYCRDNFVTVKEKTACFRRVARQEGEE